jgi:hypothetical protein
LIDQITGDRQQETPEGQGAVAEGAGRAVQRSIAAWCGCDLIVTRLHDECACVSSTPGAFVAKNICHLLFVLSSCLHWMPGDAGNKRKLIDQITADRQQETPEGSVLWLFSALVMNDAGQQWRILVYSLYGCSVICVPAILNRLAVYHEHASTLSPPCPMLCAAPQNWLDLSLNRGMPSSLLLLSRAFTLTSPLPSAAAGAPGAADDLGRVKETLLTLPEEVIQDVGLEVAAATSGEGGGRYVHATCRIDVLFHNFSAARPAAAFCARHTIAGF